MISRRRMLVTAAALGLLSWALHARVSTEFDRRRLYHSNDALFQTDPLNFLLVAIRGETPDFARHPALLPLVHGTAIAGGATLALVSDDNQQKRRRAVGKALAPVAAGVETAAVFLAFCLIGVGWLAALALAILGSTSSASLLVGSVPDTFALSAALLALAALLAALHLRAERPRLGWWVAVGALTFAVTSTNLGAVGLLLFLVERQRRGDARGAAITAARVVVASVVLALLAHAAWAVAVPGQPSRRYPVTRWMGVRPLQAATTFPVAVASIYAPPPVIAVDRGGHTVRRRHNAAFVDERDQPLATGLRVAAVAFMLALGWLGWRRAGSELHPIPIAAVAILALNFTIHCFFGHRELFLYSPHWQMATLILLAGVVVPNAQGRRMPGGAWLLGGFIVATAIAGGLSVRAVLTMFELQ